MKKIVVSMVAISAVFFLLGNMSYAQERTGTLEGTVTDSTGEILPGSTVELSGEKLMGGARSIIANERGKFRFPNLLPGIYEVTVTMEGFQSSKKTQLRVNVGGTLTVEVILNQATIEESVMVSAESPVVDVQKSEVSTNITSDLMEVMPMRRFSFFDFVGTTPGVTSGEGGYSNNWQSALGSGGSSNTYYFEGVETTDPEGGGSWLWANPDQIEEIDVIVSGAPAEYGNFQGMVVNLVAKTGSNTFAGSLNYYYRANWLTGNNTPDEEFPFYRDKYYEATGTIGGPIIQDKLWFFVAGQYLIDQTVGVGADPAFGSGLYRYPTTFGRLDWQVHQNHKFTLSVDWNFYRQEGTPDAYTPYEAQWSEEANNPVVAASWSSVLSQNTFIDIKYAGWWVTSISEAADGDRETPYRYDAATGMSSGNYRWWGDWPLGQQQIQGSVTHFADDFLLGDHEFKIGAIYNHSWASWKWGYNSNRYYYDWDGYPYFVYYMLPEEYGGVSNRISAFIDDSWTPHNRLTLNLGLRFDHTRGGYPEYSQLDENANPTDVKFPADPDLLRWDTFSPRLGLVYQLTTDGKTVFKASAGRYYGHMLMNVMYRSAPSKSDKYWYEYNWDTEEFDILYEHIDPLLNLGFDRNMKNPYSDQYTLGIEREIFPDFSLALTGIYKKSKDSVGQMDEEAKYETLDYFDEFGNQTIQVYNQTNDYAENLYVTTNPGGYTDYRALILTFRKRLSHNWQVFGSFTYSKGRDFPERSTDPNYLINTHGRAGNMDREYALKLSGTYIFPYGIMFSAYFSHEQGRPFNRTILLTGLDQGIRRIAAEKRGSQRYPDVTFLDLRVEKDFRLYKQARLKLLIDVWNIFNADYYSGIAETNADSDVYLAPQGFTLPRRAQLGIRFVF